MHLDEPRWIRALSSQRHWGLGGVRPTPSQPLQHHQAQGHPSPVDGAESGNGFQPKGLGLLAAEARGLPGRAGSGCKRMTQSLSLDLDLGLGLGWGSPGGCPGQTSAHRCLKRWVQ